MGGKRGDRSTPPAVRLAEVLTARVDVLRQHAAGARRGTVVGVHQARVATRRLREVVPVAAVHLQGVRRRRLRRVLRQMTRALGAVRECDVALAMVTALQEGATSDVRGWLRGWVAALRLRRRDARVGLLEVVSRADVDRLSHWIDDLAAARAASPDDAWRTRLARQLDARARTLRLAIDDAGVLFVPEALHEVRIAAKRLRYAIELVGECRLAAVGRLLATLKRAQDVLGRLHDLDVLLEDGHWAGVPQDALVAGPRPDAVAQMIAQLDAERRRQHATYLRRRAALVRVADHVRDSLVLRAGTDAGVAAASGVLAHAG